MTNYFLFELFEISHHFEETSFQRKIFKDKYNSSYKRDALFEKITNPSRSPLASITERLLQLLAQEKAPCKRLRKKMQWLDSISYLVNQVKS